MHQKPYNIVSGTVDVQTTVSSSHDENKISAAVGGRRTIRKTKIADMEKSDERKIIIITSLVERENRE